MEAKKQTAFAIRSWSDITALILIFTFIVSGLIWGMKLESRYDALDLAYEALAIQVGSGILPRAEERLVSHDAELKRMREELKRIDERISNHGVNGTRH